MYLLRERTVGCAVAGVWLGFIGFVFAVGWQRGRKGQGGAREGFADQSFKVEVGIYSTDPFGQFADFLGIETFIERLVGNAGCPVR